MKKNLFRLFGGTLALIALIAAISFALSARPQASAPGSSIQALEERLRELGVPVQSVTVTKESPLEVEVTIQSAESDEIPGRENLWNRSVSRYALPTIYTGAPNRY
jgi:hypothetical protein